MAKDAKKNEDIVVDELVEEVIPEVTEAEIEHDAELEEAELLAELPELKDPVKLRIRERNALLELVLRAEKVIKSEEVDEMTEKLIGLELMASIDEFAESIAVDKNAYVEWAEGREYDAFLALLNRYSSALGK